MAGCIGHDGRLLRVVATGRAGDGHDDDEDALAGVQNETNIISIRVDSVIAT